MEAKKISFWSGIITGLAMICYFLLMKLLKLNYILELHYMNFLFLFFGIFYTTYKQRKKLGTVKYLAGLLAGVKTTFISAVLFNVFLAVYLSVIDPHLMEHIMKTVPLGRFMSPLAIAVVSFMEETGAGVVMSLIVMQYYKTKNNEDKI